MTYDALTIDTQVVYSNDLALNTGLLGQLSQFKGGLVKIVLSEITVREIHKALTEKAKATHDALSKAIKSGISNGQLTAQHETELVSVRNAMEKPQDHAKRQLSEFVNQTDAEIVAMEAVDIKKVLDRYFRNEAPFSSKGKKNEFPDAIALLTLENWAIQNRKRILAVSGDADWRAFAEHSEHIDVVDDLGKALSRLNELAEATVPLARKVLELISSNDNSLAEHLETSIERALESEFPYLEFSGPMPGEDEGASLSLIDFEIPGLDDHSTEIDIVRVGTDGFAFRVPVLVVATVHAEISFSIHDSIDRDFIPMGSTSIEQEIEFDAFLLLEISHFLNDPDDKGSVVYEIDKVELLDAPSTIDIGYIDYSLAEPDYDFELENLREGASNDGSPDSA